MCMQTLLSALYDLFERNSLLKVCKEPSIGRLVNNVVPHGRRV